ncbi:MAG: FtsX-like permease family protein, partial [Chthoniobacterales bacterium]
DRTGLTNAIKQAIWKVDPLLAIGRPESMDEVLAISLAGQRFNTFLLGAFAAMALLLASVGLYGLLAFGVAQRTREIGIRLAVGAQRRDVLVMVLRQGLTLTLLGVAFGVAISLGSTRVLSRFLYGVTPTDAPTFAAVAMLLVGVALAACLIPARRATKVDPIVALRYE